MLHRDDYSILSNFIDQYYDFWQTIDFIIEICFLSNVYVNGILGTLKTKIFVTSNKHILKSYSKFWKLIYNFRRDSYSFMFSG